MHGSTSPAEERIAVPGRVAGLEHGMLADEIDRAARLRARRIEPEDPQQVERVHRVVPLGRPRRAAPVAVGRLETEQPRTPALGGDLRPLRRDDLGRLRRCRSAITCQRIAGSPASSQSMTSSGIRLPPCSRSTRRYRVGSIDGRSRGAGIGCGQQSWTKVVVHQEVRSWRSSPTECSPCSGSREA